MCTHFCMEYQVQIERNLLSYKIKDPLEQTCRYFPFMQSHTPIEINKYLDMAVLQSSMGKP